MKETTMNLSFKLHGVQSIHFARFLACSLPLLWLLAACSAHSPSILADNHQSIHVSVFKNETQQFALEERLTANVIKAFQRDGRLKPTTRSTADLQMEGRISSVKISPMAYSNLDRAIGYHIRIVLHVTVLDTSSGNPVVEDRPFTAQGTFLLSNEPAAAETQDVSDILAENILSFLIEGW